MRFSVLLLLAACGGSDKTGETGSDGGGDGGATIDDYIDVEVAPTGDFTGFEGGYEGSGGWLTQQLDPEKQGVTAEVDTIVEDFESGDGVPDATVALWFDDQVEGAPDATATSDSSGAVTIPDVPMCTPVAYRTGTDPALDETKDTYELHQVYGFTDGPIDEPFNSVSTTTYRLIPGLLGVDPDPAKGIAAGVAHDVNDDPIEGAQVVVVDDEGNVADGVIVHYFVDEFPNRDQPYTSADGLWVAIDIPEGEWNVQMYVSDGAGGHLLMGQTRLTVVADSINISSVYTGFGDGVKYPGSCLLGAN